VVSYTISLLGPGDRVLCTQWIVVDCAQEVLLCSIYLFIYLFNVCLVFFFRFLTLREEHRLRVFDNRVLWKILGP
jgi:hypothetical protein